MGESKVLTRCVMVKCEVSCSGMCQHRVWAFRGCSSAHGREARKGSFLDAARKNMLMP